MISLVSLLVAGIPALFIISALITWGMRRYALQKAILDIPNDRSSHTVPTPRGGGVAIVFAFLLAILVLAITGFIQANFAIALFGGSLLVAVVGYLDDVYHLPAKWRALVQVMAAIWALYWLGGFPYLNIGIWNIHLGWWGNLLAVVGIVWLINLYNFMDGIDGFAGLEGVFVSVAAGIIFLILGNSDIAVVSLLFAATIFGFLVWNWPPAKIFMGDVASGTLGFIFAVFLVHSANTTQTSPLLWIILLSVFVFDATFTLLRRIRNRESLHVAHRNHAYQYWIRKGSSHFRVTVSSFILNMIIFLPLACLVVLLPTFALLWFVLAVLISLMLWYRSVYGK